jgi:hypothetical protein
MKSVSRNLRNTLLLGSAAALLAGTAQGQSTAPEYDIVIRGGHVLDGAGNPWVDADVGIKDGRIAKVGVIAARGKREIDARNKYVSPGFIDMMDQSGEVLLENGAAENKLRQGVTTVIAGEGGTPVEAAKIPDYFKQLETQGIGVNFGTYYASHQARMQIMGDKAGAPTPAQMAAMEKEVGIAMRAGAFGITSALIYPPSSFQTTEDLIKLAKVASQCNGFYATHMREESSKLIPAIEEAIAIGEKGGVKVEIFHLKNAYAPQWGKGMPKAVALVDSARARGVDIAADMYPYTAGGTGHRDHRSQLGVGRWRRKGHRAAEGSRGPREAEAAGRRRLDGRLVEPGRGLGRLGQGSARQSAEPQIREVQRQELRRDRRRARHRSGGRRVEHRGRGLSQAFDGAVFHDERAGYRDRAAPALDQHR